MGLGKEQRSAGYASHNTDVLQDPFAGNTADLQSGNTDCISLALLIELQGKYHRILNKNHSHCYSSSDRWAQKPFGMTEIGCARYMLVEDKHASPIGLRAEKQTRKGKSLLSKLPRLPFP